MPADKPLSFEAAQRGAISRPSRAEAEDAVRTLIRWARDDPTIERLGLQTG